MLAIIQFEAPFLLDLIPETPEVLVLSLTDLQSFGVSGSSLPGTMAVPPGVNGAFADAARGRKVDRNVLGDLNKGRPFDQGRYEGLQLGVAVDLGRTSGVMCAAETHALHIGTRAGNIWDTLASASTFPDRPGLKWSEKIGQLAKVYPGPLKGNKNGKAPELYRSL